MNEIKLTKTESLILSMIKAKEGEIVNKFEIMDKMYPKRSEQPNDKIVDVFLCHIRRKYKAAGVDLPIKTIWGRGYRLEKEAIG